MFTLKELHGKLVPINVCYTIVDEVSYMQLFLSKDKKVKKEYEIKPYVRHTSKYDYVAARSLPPRRAPAGLPPGAVPGRPNQTWQIGRPL